MPRAANKRSEEVEAGLFTEFTEATTLHGFRYLTERGSAIRKILWLLLLLVCMVAAVIQVVSKFGDYSRKPILTNLDLEYPESLPFPAVAICNINQFRITYTSEHLYELITDVYKRGSAHPEDVDWPFYEQRYSDELAREAKDFLRDAGHKLKDMLLGCEWPNGTQCRQSDFNTILTEFGVCYVINRRPSAPTIVEKSGSNAGLNLLLNVEGYERMNGPTRSYGVKVVLFDAKTVPMVSQAIDLPPGYYAQIGMQYQTREKVPVSKGGNCVTEGNFTYFDDSTYSREACIKDKIVANIFEKCQCLPAMSISSKNPGRACTVAEYFACVVTEYGEPASASKCLENCTVISHVPSLSLSKLPAAFFPEVLPPAQASIEQAFHTALEARSRIQDDLVQATQHAIRDIQLADKHLHDNHYRPMIENFRSTYSRLVNEVTCYRKLKQDFAVVFAIAAEETSTEYEYSSWIDDEHYLLIMDPSGFENFELFLNSYTTMLNEHSDVIDSLKDAADTMVGTFFETTALFLEHYYDRELFNGGPPEYRNMLDAIANYQGGTISLLDLSVEIFNARHLPATLSSGFFRTIAVNLFDKIIQLLASDDYIASSQQLATSANDITLKRLLIDTVFYDLQYKNVTCMEMIFHAYKTAYANAGMSTEWLELYNPRRGRSNQNSAETTTVDGGSTYSSTNTAGTESTTQQPQQRRKRALGDSVPPVMVDKKPSDMYLWCPSVPPVDVQQMIADLRDCTADLSAFAERIYPTVEALSTDFTRPFDQLLDHLDAYQSGAELNEDFYQQNMVAINIYYQQLSIQKFKQERSYDIYSFLSDVGGTMGLFLGASIMTAFEFIDHFILKPMSERKRRRLGSVNERPTVPPIYEPSSHLASTNPPQPY